MKPLRRFLSRLTSWARTAHDEERLRAEIAEHIALQTADNLRAGMLPAEARRQAMLRFGGVEAMKEQYRDQRSLPFFETLRQDLRHSARRLRKAPAFTAATVLTLALGIGATTSIFTLAHAVLLRSLPVSKPGELYRLGREVHCCVWGGYSQDKEFSIVSYDLYRYFRANTRGFSELAAFQAASGMLFGVRRATGAEPARSYSGKFVSGNYFVMFGVRPYAGRLLADADDSPGAPPAAVMSYRLWQQKFGADRSVIGAVFNFNNHPFTIVGIAPANFYGDTLTNAPPDFFLPLATDAQVEGDNSLLRLSGSHWLELIGRIHPGASPSAIEAQMRVELKQWLHSHYGEMDAIARALEPEQTLYLSPGGAGIAQMREWYGHWINILMIVSGFALAIVCANVASLMLVRGMERRQQTSLSIALGARPSRMVRQAFTESLLLSLIGAGVGLAVASAGTRLILRMTFASNPIYAGMPIGGSPSIPVLLFALAVSLVTGIIFGIAPAWMAARIDPIEALRGANRATRRSASLPRMALVVFQAALSLVLLSASGLLTAALHRLEQQDFGFEQAGRMVVSIDPQLAAYRAGQLTQLYQRIQASLSSVPGVSSAAVAGYSPLSGDSWNDSIYVDGHPAPDPKDDFGASFNRVTAGYFNVIGNPILQGRGVDEQDSDTATHVAVVNEAFVRKFFRGEDPIGKHFGRTTPEASRQFEIVGVAKDARYFSYDLGKPPRAFFFLPEPQHDIFPSPKFAPGENRTHYLSDIVVALKPGAQFQESDVRRAMAAVDPNLPVILIHSLRDQVAETFGQQRLIARLTSFFGLLSLVLASVGLYGVTAFNAGRRTGEIGLRMALGANRGQVVGLVLRGALGLIAIGLLIGVPLTFAAGRFLGDQLYGMNPDNAAVIVISVAALALSALIASLIPALRASRISPMEALRAE
jgi:predicted permease